MNASLFSRLGTLLVVILLAPNRGAAAEPVSFVEHQGQWELAYGLVYYRVFGDVRNDTEGPLPWVRVKIELFDASGKVVLERTTFNAKAEILNDVEDPGELEERRARVKALEPSEVDLFRIGIPKDEIPATPRFVRYRAEILEPAGPVAEGPPITIPPVGEGKLDANEATADDLAKLPEMTAARVKAVMNYRRANGPLIHLEELALIPQIAPIYETISGHLGIE